MSAHARAMRALKHGVRIVLARWLQLLCFLRIPPWRQLTREKGE
jgi:hypothetical protein